MYFTYKLNAEETTLTSGSKDKAIIRYAKRFGDGVHFGK
jgi:hypothetical protein